MLHITSQLFRRKPRREYLNDNYAQNTPTIITWLKKIFIAVLLIAFGMLLMLINTPARADQPSAEFSQVYMNQVSEGSLLIKTENPQQYRQLPLLHTDVDMQVSGMILRSHIKQRFENTSKNWIEATYVFPLPETAAVDHMRMHIGERIIEGKIKEKQQARRIYEKAKREGKKTALIQQQRPNLFTNSVANIGPGESVTIEIEYQQVLHYDQGDFSLRFPLAITPRYIPGKPIEETFKLNTQGWAQNTSRVPDASNITPPVYNGPGTINPVSIRITLDAGFPLQKLHSRYHSITHTKDSNNIINIKLANGDIPSDRDFELVWTPDVGHAPNAALFTEQLKNEHYQLLMVLPPDNGGHNGQPLAREVTYIIDTSGSMHGISIQQAKKSLLMALDRLRLHDRFNIIQFNSITDQLFSRSKIASYENIIHAKQYVQALQADGGTEMAPALNIALKQSQESNYVQQVIFLTDGSVGNETELFDIINKHLGKSRLFTVGIGSAPNSYFMRKAAQFGRGTFTYISDVTEVNEKMTALFSKLESPLMTDLSIQFADDIDAQVWPKRIADLYHGEPIVLAIKTDKPLSSVTLKGTRALAPWSATLNTQQGQSNKGVGTFWARSKIASLMDSLHEGANKSKVRDEVIEVALNHHLVSKYTSLVAVDVTPSRPLETDIKTQQIPVNLPHGQSRQKIFGRLPQTATAAELELLFGFSLLILALLSQWIRWPLLKDKPDH